MISSMTDSNSYFVCKSTDVKPDVAENGKRLFEMDTLHWFIFDSDTNAWLPMFKEEKTEEKHDVIEPGYVETVPLPEEKPVKKKKTSNKAK